MNSLRITGFDLVPATGVATRRNVDHLCLVADRTTVDAIATAAVPFRLVGEPDARFGSREQGWLVYASDPDDNVVEIRRDDR